MGNAEYMGIFFGLAVVAGIVNDLAGRLVIHYEERVKEFNKKLALTMSDVGNASKNQLGNLGKMASDVSPMRSISKGSPMGTGSQEAVRSIGALAGRAGQFSDSIIGKEARSKIMNKLWGSILLGLFP